MADFNKKELKDLRRIAKKVLDKKTYKKAKKAKGSDDEAHALKYIIKSKLDSRHHKLMMQLKKLEQEEKDIFHVYVKSNLLSSKIKWFFTSFYRKELKEIMRLIKDVEKEVKNV